MSPLTILDMEIAELRWAMGYYWGKRQRDEARKAYWELVGLRRARAIIVRCADRLERVPMDVAHEARVKAIGEARCGCGITLKEHKRPTVGHPPYDVWGAA